MLKIESVCVLYLDKDLANYEHKLTKKDDRICHKHIIYQVIDNNR